MRIRRDRAGSSVKTMPPSMVVIVLAAWKLTVEISPYASDGLAVERGADALCAVENQGHFVAARQRKRASNRRDCRRGPCRGWRGFAGVIAAQRP